MGPPGGPTDSWRVYNGSLYLNFFPQVMNKFFEPAAVRAHIAQADARWAGMWGAATEVGPFNYLCGPFIPSDCWVPGTKPGRPDCCGDHPQPVPPGRAVAAATAAANVTELYAGFL
jgi:hypothetical protein